jgi:rhodanese-related sulfurtransferase
MKIESFLGKACVDAGGFAMLLTGAACIGLLINQCRDHQLPLVYVSKKGRMEDAVKQIEVSSDGTTDVSQATAVQDAIEPREISLDDFRQYVNKGDALILDARPEIFHRLGHVPGALSLPREDFDAAYAKLRSRLETDKGQSLLVYCSDAACEDSQMVADGLSKLGYRRVFVFKGGWDEWEAAHLPEEKTE